MRNILAVLVRPRSPRPGLCWTVAEDGRDELEIRVCEPATDGQANEAAVKLVAKMLGTSRSEVAIISGHSSRHKRLAVPYDARELRARLGEVTRKEDR